MADRTKNDTIYVLMLKKLTCKGDSCVYHASGLIATTKDGYFYLSVGEIPERKHQEWLSLTGCSTA